MRLEKKISVKKNLKKYWCQPRLAFQTHDPGYNTKITPYKK